MKINDDWMDIACVLALVLVLATNVAAIMAAIATFYLTP